MTRRETYLNNHSIIHIYDCCWTEGNGSFWLSTKTFFSWERYPLIKPYSMNKKDKKQFGKLVIEPYKSFFLFSFLCSCNSQIITWAIMLANMHSTSSVSAATPTNSSAVLKESTLILLTLSRQLYLQELHGVNIILAGKKKKPQITRIKKMDLHFLEQCPDSNTSRSLHS